MSDGSSTKVDDVIYSIVYRKTWYIREGYVLQANTNVRLHRLVMELNGFQIEGKEVHHKDENPLNNQVDNLLVYREHSTHIHNHFRESKYNHPKGVWKRNREGSKLWCARIKKDGIIFNLGSFWTKEEAVLAYNKKARELYGTHALLNTI